jgi:hypothetical protein
MFKDCRLVGAHWRCWLTFGRQKRDRLNYDSHILDNDGAVITYPDAIHPNEPVNAPGLL